QILAVKSSTYFLGEVPDLHSLVDNMTSQQLAHFSRVLALLVFEPEYRQLMESAHVLRSMELLQLRRDRVVRADSIIDKNQALILSAPSLLPRLMELLRVMNFNPSLASFDERAIELEEAHIAQVRISVVTGSDPASGAGGMMGSQQQQQPQPVSEWGYLADLRAVAEAVPPPEAGSPAPAASAQAPASERTQVDRQRPRNNTTSSSSSGGGSTGGSSSGGGGGEPSRIGNFFRSIFRRSNSSQRSEPAAAAEGGSGSGENAGEGTPAERRAAELRAAERTASGSAGARAAAEAAGLVAERLQLSAAQQHREAALALSSAAHRLGGGAGVVTGANGGGGGAGAHAGGGDGLPGFTIRDLLGFLQPAFVGPDPAGSIALGLEQALTWPIGGMMGSGVGVGLGPGGGIHGTVGRRRLQQPTAEEARQELQFAGLMLAPHQVEVLFVLCTLLGARRKGEAHQALANLGLIDVLGSMFDRLSWGVPPSTQGPHGAHCDCNPESALRVQYLRLVHNFLDR
ncbi:unnamed protein product, partial [Hapterophycus canaliculatus]